MEDGGREVLDRADQLQPGVVDQYVRARGGELGGVQIHEVEHVRLDAAPEALGLPGQRLQACGIPVDCSHLGAGGREPQRAGAADAAGSAGDEGGAATEVEQGGGEGVGRGHVPTLGSAPTPSHVVALHSSARSSGVKPCGCVSHGLLDTEAPELVQLRQRVHGEPGDIQ